MFVPLTPCPHAAQKVDVFWPIQDPHTASPSWGKNSPFGKLFPQLLHRKHCVDRSINETYVQIHIIIIIIRIVFNNNHNDNANDNNKTYEDDDSNNNKLLLPGDGTSCSVLASCFRQ